MATRYSGKLTIRIVFVDADNQYEARVSRQGKHLSTMYVGTPKVLPRSVDSPLAYDLAARAALNFLANHDEQTGMVSDRLDDAALDEAGFHIGRDKASRYPRVAS